MILFRKKGPAKLWALKYNMSVEHDRILLFLGLRIFIGRSRHLSEELTNAPSAS